MSTEIVREKTDSKQEEVMAAQVEIWKYIHGFTPIAAIKCAIDLGIPDILDKHKSPVTLSDLALEIGCVQYSLHRIMRFLVEIKIFQQTSDGYVQTSISRLLTKHGDHSMVDLLLLVTNPVMIAPWQKLSAWVLENKELPFEAAHGYDLWGFCVANPDMGMLFNKGMACDAQATVTSLIKGCPQLFHGVKMLVDVGGGDGTALHLIVEAYPVIKCINFDLPHVVSMVAGSTSNGVVEYVGGNMFDHVPKADAVYLMKVLHDWDDEQCIDILKNCRKAIPQETGKVIIVDIIVGREEDNEFKNLGLMFDLTMMTYTSKGKERTLEEWSKVIHEAGFTSFTVKDIQAPQSVIEVFP